MSEAGWLEAWDEVVAGGNSAAVEEFWMARLEEGVGDGEAFVEALRRLRGAGKKTIAGTLLELAAEEARGEGAWAARKRFLSEMIRLGLGDADAWRKGLDESVRRQWAGRPSLDRLLAHFALTSARKPLEALEALETWLEFDVGGVFAMAGRGAGRVVEVNPQLGVLRLDFEKEKRVPMPVDAARKHLTPLAPAHFLRRRLEDRAALEAEVRADPPAGLAAILESFGAEMTVPEIKAALAGMVPETAWTSWWNKAKKNPQVLARGAGTRVSYRLANAGGADAEVRRDFDAAKFEDQVDLARRHLGRGRELAAFMGERLIARAAEPGAAPGVAWEAIALAARAGVAEAEVEAARAALLARAGAPALLAAIGDASQREAALEFVRAHDRDAWPDVFAAWMPSEPSAKLLLLIAGSLVHAGRASAVSSFLDDVMVHPGRHPAAFVWACEEDAAALRPMLEERRTGALLVRMVELAERKEFVSHRGRFKALLSAGGLAGRLVAERLTVDQARRIVQILEHPGELADERNWLRRAVTARFPELRQAPELDVVPALPATVTRLQAELKDLLEKQIPETLRAIQEARAHGDLSENFEYHAARARQEYLSARASELQGDLGKVRVIDPATVDTSRVRVGTRVWLRPKLSGDRRAIVILGPYEADPEHGVLSHGSEAAQGLLERAPGEAVRFAGGAWVVESVEPAL